MDEPAMNIPINVGLTFPRLFTPGRTKLTPVLPGTVLIVVDEFHRGHIPDRAVRPFFIVLSPPGLNHDLRLLEGEKPNAHSSTHHETCR